MLKSLLIANRGEIACRIIRTARRMGVRTVAVYSDADRDAPHVRMADAAVHIGASPARESYLVGERILAAAHETGAEAIHPGYGFLSENADFAQAVIDAGLIWVGPKPESIRAMGLKDAAKARMIAAGVPVTPGYQGEDQAPERLKAEADRISYPVLIKAVAGGGGKGMRRVDDPAAFEDALLSCRREAASSFGDDRVLIERYITAPRHIEVQVFGDSHGHVVHLFERDCTLQRRHQKVIEEAPAPGMDSATREAVCGAAVRAAQAVDYVGAGTIEFIADASAGLKADRIWFMEMNTRLQVEHPVTEAITGQDLVEWQLRVASGEPLPLRQDELRIDGWAMEARLYAEAPERGFLPSIGRLERLVLPRDRVRVDSGVEEGGEVASFYDPMIAKLIAHAPTRGGAAGALADACDRVATWPVANNAGFLSALLRAPAFLAAEVTTNFIQGALETLLETRTPAEAPLAAAASRLAAAGDGPWSALAGFRLNAPSLATVRLSVDGTAREVALAATPDPDAELLDVGDGWLAIDRGWPHLVQPDRAEGRGAASAGDGAVLAPMPGRVIAVEVAADAPVSQGQKLLTLEAMKMEHTLVAPFDGVVEALAAAPGAQVREGETLARIRRAEAA
ncbi:MAG: acetyl/propionyl/methylcrotonyl-CoA carboxylase subunit alpha [Caulobacteraceae bacterium]|nr:acetyl/propionyl/methylcrotonyl-CoA carboxylase subunit alpha [Caulobacter sp.]